MSESLPISVHNLNCSICVPQGNTLRKVFLHRDSFATFRILGCIGDAEATDADGNPDNIAVLQNLERPQHVLIKHLLLTIAACTTVLVKTTRKTTRAYVLFIHIRPLRR